MNIFYNQAKHNLDFLGCVKANYPEQFFDWKITILFYISIHLIKCLAYKRGVNIGSTHYDIERALNPSRGMQVTPFPDWAWRKYSRLFKYSRDSRYDGILDERIIRIAQEKNFIECEKIFDDFLKYMASNEITL